MKPLVYVAGPYTSPDPVANTRRALGAGREFIECGLITPIVPHLSLLWDLVHPMPYEDWLAYDLELLEHCHAVYRLSGASTGADGEVDHAEALGLPIFTARSPLFTWAHDWNEEHAHADR